LSVLFSYDGQLVTAGVIQHVSVILTIRCLCGLSILIDFIFWHVIICWQALLYYVFK